MGLIAGLVIALIAIRSVVVLGVPTVSVLYFASYTMVSIINVGDFIQRIEITVSIVFMFGGFLKVCICLFAACKGFTGILNIPDYRKMVAPIGLLMFVFSLTIYENTMEMFNWAEKIYPYYAIPFQIIIPLLTLVIAEIKRLSKKHR